MSEDVLALAAEELLGVLLAKGSDMVIDVGCLLKSLSVDAMTSLSPS